MGKSLNNTVNEEEINLHALLCSLLGSDAFVTPDAMSKALCCVISTLKSEIRDKREASTEAKYLPQVKLAKIFGLSESKCMRMLRPLVAEGRIRVLQGITESGKACNRLFNVEDFEKAYLVEGGELR